MWPRSRQQLKTECRGGRAKPSSFSRFCILMGQNWGDTRVRDGRGEGRGLNGRKSRRWSSFGLEQRLGWRLRVEARVKFLRSSGQKKVEESKGRRGKKEAEEIELYQFTGNFIIFLRNLMNFLKGLVPGSIVSTPITGKSQVRSNSRNQTQAALPLDLSDLPHPRAPSYLPGRHPVL